ncbi:MAG: alginate export family protein [candidate division Zixibacteria bacterium]|nr:alginate export family protein [candidate division Zixibacteria bacterium]
MKTTLAKRITAMRIFSFSSIALALFLAFSPQIADAGEPEYMELKYELNMAYEIKGKWDTSGVFVATDIEPLPKPRKPKLRGEIQKIDKKKKTITIFGTTIRIKDDTEFNSGDSATVGFGKLEVGQRVEVSCKVREGNKWKARSIKIKGVKKSNKIKGSITRVSIDGVAPDTIEIHGLLIILNRKTDVDEHSGLYEDIEKELFGDLSLDDANDVDDGFTYEDKILFTGKYRGSFRTVSEFDLTKAFDDDQFDTNPSLKVEATGFWSESVKSFTQLRVRKKYIISTDRTPQQSSQLDIQLVQAYMLFKDIGRSGVGLQIGRQDFDEPREWLFDEYLDAVRIYYYGKAPLIVEAAFIKAVEPLKEKFRDWTDLYASVSWRFDKRSRASAYVLKRSDRSIRNREPVWFGLRYYGRPKEYLRPWAELSILRGEDKGLPQRAYAIDFGATFISAKSVYHPSFTIGYAIGSGDKTGADNESNKFRQTSYEDNVAVFGGVAALRYYGEALNPELSNIKILTLGVGVHPLPDASVDFVYHSYKQHEIDNDLTDSELLDPPAKPLGQSDDLGWGLDIKVASPKIWDHVRLRWTTAIFSPGEAFGPRQETALLHKINWDYEF